MVSLCTASLRHQTCHSRCVKAVQGLCWIRWSCCQRRSQTTAANITPSQSNLVSKSNSRNGRQSVREPKLPPHSLLSTKMLLRSLLISTISSTPLLLNPALKFLLLLTKRRFTLLNVDKNWFLHALLKKTFYEHFCAGENRPEVTATIDNIKTIGFRGVILTYAREIVVDERSMQDKGLGAQMVTGEHDIPHDKEKFADIDSWRSGVLETLDMVDDGDFLALKFTGAGQAVTQALKSNNSLPTPMIEALETICANALQRDVRILVDAEQQSVQPAIDTITLNLMRRFNKSKGRAVVYNTYQMYLKSTTAGLNEHMQVAAHENFTLGAKVVRGAYISSEPRHLIHDTKEDTDKAYDDSIRNLLLGKYVDPGSAVPGGPPSVNLFVASHNKDSAIDAVKLYQQRIAEGAPTVDKIEYGQLLGMADGVSCELLQMGASEEPANHSSSPRSSQAIQPEVYKCLSWGTLNDCLSYLLRRAVENKDAVSRTKAEQVAVRAEIWRRMKASMGLA